MQKSTEPATTNVEALTRAVSELQRDNQQLRQTIASMGGLSDLCADYENEAEYWRCKHDTLQCQHSQIMQESQGLLEQNEMLTLWKQNVLDLASVLRQKVVVNRSCGTVDVLVQFLEGLLNPNQKHFTISMRSSSPNSIPPAHADPLTWEDGTEPMGTPTGSLASISQHKAFPLAATSSEPSHPYAHRRTLDGSGAVEREVSSFSPVGSVKQSSTIPLSVVDVGRKGTDSSTSWYNVVTALHEEKTRSVACLAVYLATMTTNFIQRRHFQKWLRWYLLHIKKNISRRVASATVDENGQKIDVRHDSIIRFQRQPGIVRKLINFVSKVYVEQRSRRVYFYHWMFWAGYCKVLKLRDMSSTGLTPCSTYPVGPSFESANNQSFTSPSTVLKKDVGVQAREDGAFTESPTWSPQSPQSPLSPIYLSGGYGGRIQPPSSPTLPPEIEANLRRFQQENQVNPIFMSSLRQLYNYEVVIVIDDSGTMSSPADAQSPTVSRWTELRRTLQMVMGITEAMEKVIDIYFMNRGSVRNVEVFEQVEQAFRRPPSGITPTASTLEQVWANKKVGQYSHPMVVCVFTDGMASNQFGNSDMFGLEFWLRNRIAMRHTYLSFCMCTDERDIAKKYRPLKHRVKGELGWKGPTTGVSGVDIRDDIRGERNEARRLRGKNFQLSLADYAIKCLVGALEPTVHAVDLPLGTSIYSKDGSSTASDCSLM